MADLAPAGYAACCSLSPSSVFSQGRGQASCRRESDCLCHLAPKRLKVPSGCLGLRGDAQGAAVVGNRSYTPRTLIPAGSRSWPGLGLTHPREGSDLFGSEEHVLLGEAQAAQVVVELLQVLLAHVGCPRCQRNSVVKGERRGGGGSFRGCFAPWWSP